MSWTSILQQASLIKRHKPTIEEREKVMNQEKEKYLKKND